MYLSRIEIDNFRGIRSSRIDLNETTVLVGENDSGKTTLLDAISLILSPIQENISLTFKYQDFFMLSNPEGYQAAGPIRISLTFRERVPDEWSSIRNNDFGLKLPDDSSVRQELTLEVMAAPPQNGEASEARWRIIVEDRNKDQYSNDKAILSWIRRLNPVFRIKSGILTSLPGKDDSIVMDDALQSAQLADDHELKNKIEQSYKNLISGESLNMNADLYSGYNAALNYLAKASDLFSPDGPPLDHILYEILGRRPSGTGKPAKRIILRKGSAAEKIGMLMFTAAFLQSGGVMADPSAEPIIIIEDPEANLHPMTLESVKLLIERLKWQKIITTYSGALLSDFPLEEIRRITRNAGYIRQYSVRPGSLSHEELRRLSYHVRKRLNMATFARCWLLVEGESENWLLPYIARLCGYDLTMEGVVCVEFAQCGIAPLIKAARQLGIEWFLLADGDAAGKSYIDSAKHFALQAGESFEDHCMRFREKDIEHHFFFNGYAQVYQEYAGIAVHVSQNMPAGRIINRAIHRNSKPFMAIAIVEAIARQGSPGISGELRNVVEKVVKLAKGSADSSKY
jgi:putative ATP-dependent endonuclease of OLD family